MALNLNKNQRFFIRFILLIGIILSFSLFFFVHKWEEQRLAIRFIVEASDRARAIEDTLGDNVDALYSIASFYSSSHKVEREEFATFTKNIPLRHPAIIELDWIPRIPHSEREFYYPLDYIEPSENSTTALGFDFGSDPAFRKAIEEAIDSGEPVTTGRINLTGKGDGNFGCRVFLPIYINNQPHDSLEERRMNLAGLVSAFFRLDTIVESSLKRLTPAGIDIYLYEKDDNIPDEGPLYMHISRLNQKKPVLASQKDLRGRGGLEWVNIIEVGRRKWAIVCVRCKEFLTAHKNWNSWFVLFIGLVLTFSLVIYMSSIANRSIEIEALVFKRTKELAQANDNLKKKIIECQIEEEEIRKLSRAVEANPSSIVITNEKGNIEYINPKCVQLTGYTLSELLGKNPRVFSSKEKPEGFYKDLWQTITSGREWRGEFHNKKKNGELYWEMASISPIKDSEGRITHFVAVKEDITEHKRILAELEKKNKELEQLDELKSEFVSTVSHELRTPLSITKEGISLVLDGIPGTINEKQKKVLTSSRDNIDRLSRIINDLLDISKIEAGRVELKRELVDINGLIKKVASFFESKALSKGLTLKLDLPPQATYIYIDADKIIQVFTNLVSNAIKFTRQGTIEIQAREAKDGVECSVSDTGVGISQEDLPKIFGKFQQFARAPGPGEKGTGLGLSIAKGIIDVHKGNIRVESAPGEGTKFIFFLPHYTSEMVFREYINSGIREALKHDTKMSLISVSLVAFDKVKEKFSAEEVRSILKELESVMKNSLRRKGDIVVKDTGEAIVILVDCGKDNSLIVEGRLEQALESYLEAKKLSQAIQLRLSSVTYPDEARDSDEMINRARRA